MRCPASSNSNPVSKWSDWLRTTVRWDHWARDFCRTASNSARSMIGGCSPGRDVNSLAVSAIVIAGPDQGPSGMGLAFDIGGGSIVLRIQRVELLVEPLLKSDRTCTRFGYFA